MMRFQGRLLKISSIQLQVSQAADQEVRQLIKSDKSPPQHCPAALRGVPDEDCFLNIRSLDYLQSYNEDSLLLLKNVRDIL